MPAGFNKGQVEYIKAIANVNGHKTYKSFSYRPNLTSNTNDLNRITTDNLCRYQLWCLGNAPNVRDSTGAIGILSSVEPLTAFNIVKSTNSDGLVLANQREGDEGFLESTHIRMRVVLAHGNNSFAADHCECRLIVFRARDRQHHLSTHMMDVNNPYFNLFHGYSNYNIGFAGYERKEALEGDVTYMLSSAATDSGTGNVGNQDAMTLPVNKESWIVMKDHRFYLGKEYGGKNIYETTLHWDWKDPIATASDDITETENDKNYVWYILLMANNNNFLTADAPDINVRMMGTTHMTSG